MLNIRRHVARQLQNNASPVSVSEASLRDLSSLSYTANVEPPRAVHSAASTLQTLENLLSL